MSGNVRTLKISGIIFLMLFLFSCKSCKKINEPPSSPPIDERNISRVRREITGLDIEVEENGKVHIVWIDSMENGWEIIYKMKENGEWKENEVITIRKHKAIRSRLALDHFGNPHVIWEEDSVSVYVVYPRIYYTYKKNGKWVEPLNISENMLGELPDIGVDGDGRVHVIWMDGASQYICYRKKEEDIWEPIVTLPTRYNLNPAFYVERNGNLHITYEDYTYEIYYISSIDGGNTWGENINVSNSPGIHSALCDVVVCEGRVYICWGEGSGKGIWYATQDINGNFVKYEIPGTTGEVTKYGAPSIRVENNEIYLMFSDMVEDEFYYVKRNNNGWSEMINVSNTPGSSSIPFRTFEVLNKKIYVVWVENREDVYYDEIQTF